jgi:hypothetical protein
MSLSANPLDHAAAPAQPAAEAQQAAVRSAENTFMMSMMWAGVRCILEYVVLPFALPLLGLTGRFGAPIVLVLNLIALVTLVSSVRKFYAVNYRNKHAYLAVSLVAGVIIIVFIVQSALTLLS